MTKKDCLGTCEKLLEGRLTEKQRRQKDSNKQWMMKGGDGQTVSRQTMLLDMSFINCLMTMNTL